jgi:tripartite-type tricarboxylate transporter receptor subunit TctC
VTLVVPFEAGGSTDVSARVVAKALSEVLGQPVIVLNQPGAGGRIGTRRVATAEPDGYALLWGSGSTLAVAPVLYPDQTYLTTLVPVSLGALQPFLFVTSPETGAGSIGDLVALARQKPGVLNFASAGVGSSNHLLGEIFMSATNTRFVHVPYKGATSARDAVIRGDAQLMDEVLAPLIAQIKTGQLVPLLITSDTREPTLPNVPTAKEAGFPDLSITGFFGLVAPPKTPPDVVATLNVAMKKALASPELRKSFATMSFDVGSGSSEDLAAIIARGRERYGRIVAERNIRVE